LEGSWTILPRINELDLFVTSVCTVTAFVTTYLVARFQSRNFLRMGIGGIDIHKAERPVRAEMGGLAVLAGLTTGSTVFFALDFPTDGTSPLFAAAFSTVALTGLVGIADDLKEISQKLKPLCIVAASTPLVYLLLGRTAIFIPVVGSVDLGLLYPLVAVPLAITTSANFANLLAGFNGLEAGCAAISLGTMAFIAEMTGHSSVAALGFILTFAYVGFLGLNWYPARIFPGDTGTLMAGAGLAAMGLAAGLEFEAVILSIPAAIDFALKMMHRHPFGQRNLYGNTTVRPDGTLEPAKYPAVVHAFMRVSPISERRLVVSVISMQALYAIIAIVVTLVFLR
jgi:UDP-N-acetylglucosamine--dolichyl-phosphate N-acetylglucosaminephosphotransferase